MGSNDRRFEKGSFSRADFPVAQRYIYPAGRGRLFAAGAIGLALLASIFLADAMFGRAATVAHGALSESHALFGSDCAACHTPLEGATDGSCATCHEKFGSAVGAYSFEQHYLYRSGDPDRSAPSSSEWSCAACHREHEGRTATLMEVPDSRCQSCHEVGSFPGGHPEFDFVAEQIPDPANLRFPHVLHVTEVMLEFELLDVEAACLRCHVPEPAGASFLPLSFASQCDACHLRQSTATPELPLASEDGSVPGVATLAQIRGSGGPGTLWADYWNPNEFQEGAGGLRKRPVYHEDPWVLYNLRELRGRLYPGAELADLLNTSPEVAPGDVRTLPLEAIGNLREQIRAIQGSPSAEVQGELATMTELLDAVEGRLANPFAPIDGTRYGVRIVDRASDLPDEVAYEEVIDSLTSACQTCHLVENATLRRVQTDQRALLRAEFDHRAHITHARCLDCHSTIPVRDFLAAGEDEAPETLDRAEIQNIPPLTTCASCHSERGAPNQCISCHLFHPDKAHWGNLSRYEQRFE